MQKELNPDLFGERVTQQSATNGSIAYNPVDSSVLNQDRQILELKNQNKYLADQLNKVVSTLNEFMKNSNLKSERLTQGLNRLEQSHNGLAAEAGQKIGQLSQKIQERRAFEQKVQEMVDRHNNVVRSFEVRMNHLQKLLADKEAQFLAAQSALNESKMEIARLKRL